MEAARVVRRNSGDGSRLYGRGCFSFGGLVCSHLPIFFILIVERMDGSCAKIPKLVFFLIALYVLYTYMLKQRRKVLGKGKTVGGINKAR